MLLDDILLKQDMTSLLEIEKFPIAFDKKVEIEEDFAEVVYSILSWDDVINLKQEHEQYVVDEVEKLKYYIAQNQKLSGTMKFYLLRKNILRCEIFSGEDVFQLEAHLGNGNYCFSRNFVPISMTSMRNIQ